MAGERQHDPPEEFAAPSHRLKNPFCFVTVDVAIEIIRAYIT